jgi:hypothetical protein
MKKLNGYRPTHRNRWKLIAGGILTLQHLSLLEYFADIVDFDYKHEKYGLFEIDFYEIKQIFNCSENTIRGWHKQLLLLGFIEKTTKLHWYKLVCNDSYINQGEKKGRPDEYAKIEKDQPIEIILQSFGLNLQTIEEKLQQIEKKKDKQKVSTTETDSIAIGSSKDEYKNSLVSPFVTSDSPRTMADYKKIKEEMGFKLLNEEDMKWIDENIHEDQPVPS